MNKLAVAFEKTWKMALVLSFIGIGLVSNLGVICYDKIVDMRGKGKDLKK